MRSKETASTVGVAQIAELLTELSQVQTELLALLKQKQQQLISKSPEEMLSLLAREQDLAQRMEACQERRAHLLSTAKEQGLPHDSIAALAEVAQISERGPLRAQIKESSARMRLLQHHSLVNWVLAQRALLHVAQLLEIIATGGRLQPTYGNGTSPTSRGNLLNSEA